MAFPTLANAPQAAPAGVIQTHPQQAQLAQLLTPQVGAQSGTGFQDFERLLKMQEMMKKLDPENRLGGGGGGKGGLLGGLLGGGGGVGDNSMSTFAGPGGT